VLDQLASYWKVSIDPVKFRYGLLHFPEALGDQQENKIRERLYSIFLHIGDLNRYHYGFGKVQTNHWRYTMR